MLTLGILGSGSGSNMQAILDAIHAGTLQARIAIVLSDSPDALILQRATNHGIPTALIDCSPFPQKFPEHIQQATALKLKQAGVDLVCLAGFMRLVKQPLLEAFPSRILNIHPSLLPAFPGVAAWEQAIHAKADKTGVTVHLVDEGMDTGPILLQESLEILPEETPEQLHTRLQQIEHRIYPQAISLYAQRLAL
jgi:phosphoribosylglycinamide formyltransferase 1